MLKKTLAIITLIVLVAGATAVIAQYLVQYYYPNLGSLDVTLEMYLGGVQYGNTTAIDWGPLEPGYVHMWENMTVVNVGFQPLNVTVTTKDLPSDWTLTWTGNGTVLAVGENVTAPLELYIPSDATSWPDWGFYINGEA